MPETCSPPPSAPTARASSRRHGTGPPASGTPRASRRNRHNQPVVGCGSWSWPIAGTRQIGELALAEAGRFAVGEVRRPRDLHVSSFVFLSLLLCFAPDQQFPAARDRAARPSVHSRTFTRVVPCASLSLIRAP